MRNEIWEANSEIKVHLLFCLLGCPEVKEVLIDIGYTLNLAHPTSGWIWLAPDPPFGQIPQAVRSGVCPQQLLEASQAK